MFAVRRIWATIWLVSFKDTNPKLLSHFRKSPNLFYTEKRKYGIVQCFECVFMFVCVREREIVCVYVCVHVCVFVCVYVCVSVFCMFA